MFNEILVKDFIDKIEKLNELYEENKTDRFLIDICNTYFELGKLYYDKIQNFDKSKRAFQECLNSINKTLNIHSEISMDIFIKLNILKSSAYEYLFIISFENIMDLDYAYNMLSLAIATLEEMKKSNKFQLEIDKSLKKLYELGISFSKKTQNEKIGNEFYLKLENIE